MFLVQGLYKELPVAFRYMDDLWLLGHKGIYYLEVDTVTVLERGTQRLMTFFQRQ
jgi:hypothetical protein